MAWYSVDNIERWWTDTFDSFRHVVGERIHPATIEHRLVRTMEANAQIHVMTTVVPNRYRVLLAPADYDLFCDQEQALADRFVEALRSAARRSVLEFVAEPTVEVAAEIAVPPGRIWIEFATADAGVEPWIWARTHPRPSRPGPSRAAPPTSNGVPAYVGSDRGTNVSGIRTVIRDTGIRTVAYGQRRAVAAGSRVRQAR